jgi:hypothetical protein
VRNNFLLDDSSDIILLPTLKEIFNFCCFNPQYA